MNPPIRPAGPPWPEEDGPTPTRPGDSSTQPPTDRYESEPPGSSAGGGPTPSRESPGSPFPAASTVGPYLLLGEVNRGGMGIVYRAQHQRLDRVVALKTLPGEAAVEPQVVQRFEREMRAAARLHHPNIITIYEVGEHGGIPYYTMAYAAQGSLARHRARLHEDQRAALVLLEKVARAVHYAHQQGVLHRDLKPGNILLDERGEPLVADFGLAKFREIDVELTRSGDVLGTPSYMAPEQAAGRMRQVCPATDVWALGVILFELLTGRRPFAADSRAELVGKIRREAPPPLRALRADLDPALETVVSRCLEKAPGRRYPSAEALADDLARVLRGEPPAGRPGRGPRRLGRVMRSHPLASLAAAVCLLAALTLVGAGLSAWLSGEPSVVLIGSGGPPRTWRWLAGEKESRVLAEAPEAPFTLQSSDLALVELLAAAPWEHFRLEAEVRHEESGKDRMEAVGLFFAHVRHPAPQGLYHSFWNLAFADRGLDAGNRAIGLTRYREAPLPHLAHTQPLSRLPGSSDRERPDPSAQPWHPIAVEVTGREVRAFWDNRLLVQSPISKAEILSDWPFNGVPEVRGPFTPRGGLGVFVSQARASFRQVVIRRLP